jgi:PAS domain S-box-containing protein
MSDQKKGEKETQVSGNQNIQDDQARFFLASVIDTMRDSVVTIDLDGNITSWNKSAEKLYGYPRNEAVGKSLHIVMHHRDFEPLRMSIESVQKGVKVPVYQTLRLHKDGSDLHLEISLSPVLNMDGKVIGVSTIARDITELNTTRKELATSQSRLQAVIAAAIDFAIVTLDQTGTIRGWSAGAERMFGYTPQEAIGQHTDLLFTPEDRQGNIPQVEIDLAREHGRSIDERWHLHKDGSRFFMSGVMTPLVNGPLEGFVKVGRNITDRKMAEEALYLSEERISLAVSASQMGEWEWDIRLNTVQVSKEVCVLFGLPVENRKLPLDLLLALVYPPDRQTVIDQLKAAVEGLLIFQGEYRMHRHETNEIYWVNTYGRVIAYDGKTSSRMIGVIYDITHRKHLEKQKDDFISLASHELKTPVTAIKAYSEVLEDVLTETGDQQNIAILQKLNGQVDRLTKLIESLLDSSTITEGKMSLYAETIDLNHFIGEQIEPFQRIAGNKHIRWAPNPVAMVHVDPDRIIQVVSNFVSNAVKYAPENSEILISTEDRLDGLILRVKDNGPGIDKQSQLFLFDRYFRVPGEPQRQEGIGLGLYISAAIIRQHKGTIGVESTPGEGSTFFFTLPYS